MIRATAPGSLMITGEHAVVYGHPAIVAAVEQRVTLELRPRADRRLRISSEIAAPLETSIDALSIEGPYRFVLAAFVSFYGDLKAGCDINILSDINPKLGLGSSAAVTIAALGAVAQYVNRRHEELHSRAHKIILDIQGRGSGADLAASLTGGMIAYRAPPNSEIRPLPAPPSLNLKYSGYKTPTKDVLALVADRMKGNELEFKALYQEMGSSAAAAIAAADAMDWVKFAENLNSYQLLMSRLGVSDDVLDQIIAAARETPELLAAKISGSGLGDCVLALGATPKGFSLATLATEGLIIDG